MSFKGKRRKSFTSFFSAHRLIKRQTTPILSVMRWLVSILPFLLSYTVTAQQANFEDGFSDGNFTENPEWSGDTNNFTVGTVTDDPVLDGNFLLRLNAETAGTSYLSAPSAQADGYWEFFVRQDFAPSNNNRAYIYLMSDTADLSDSGSANGYALRTGENGSNDVFRLFKITNGAEDGEILTGITDISQGGGFRVKITRNTNGDWTLETAPGYGGELVQEDTGNDNTYTSTAYFGVRTIYTATRTRDFYFDFKIDLPEPVIEPLTVTQLEKTSDRALKLSFSKDIDQTNILPASFELNPGSKTPSSVNFPDATTIQLQFGEAFPGGENSLSVTGISDLTGDTTLADTTLTFLVFEAYAAGDVAINEIMYDQPAGTPEYVELKNNSSKFLNLKNWEIGNDRSLTEIAAGDLVLYPDSFIVFTRDAGSLEEAFGPGYYIELPLPQLRNSGDQVRIYNETAETADSVQYSPAWGGTKVALERIDSRLPATAQANWGNSPHPDGGTPGRKNTIQPDTDSPELLSATVTSNRTVVLNFDRYLDAAEAENPSNFEIQPALPVSDISAQAEKVTLTFAAPMEEGRVYTLTVRNQKDIFGNRSDIFTVELRYLDFSVPEKNDIVINEIMYLREESDDPQFVELYNRTGKNIDMGLWTLTDAARNRGILPAGTVLAAGEYLVLTDKQYFADTIENGVFLTGFPALNRGGDAIRLADETGTAVDSLYYLPAWGGSARISLERKDPFAASNDASNWAASTAETGSTPGKENARRRDDTTPPKIIFANETETGLFVAFSEFISLKNDTEFTAGGLTLSIKTFDPDNGNKLWLDAALPKAKTNGTELEVFNLYDVKGNKTASAVQPVAVPVTPGAVVINEILFEPLADPNDNLPDQAQYVELYNPNDFAVSAEGFVLAGAPDEHGVKRILEPVSSEFKWIPAEGFMLFYAESDTPVFENSKTSVYFSLPPETAQFAMQFNRTSLSLRAAGDAVYLADSTGTVIDSVYYAREWHNPNLITTRGTSLERIDPAGASDEPDNWSSSTDSRGGTPGAQNSIFQAPGQTPGSAGISFSSNPFSPDDDGFEDNLFINYKLDQPDYLLHVRIFDRYGRKVRTLADGKPAGYEGYLIWDGLTDDRRQNRVGIYIVLFEAYNSASGKKQVFKKTVVLARMF